MEVVLTKQMPQHFLLPVVQSRSYILLFLSKQRNFDKPCTAKYVSGVLLFAKVCCSSSREEQALERAHKYLGITRGS